MREEEIRNYMGYEWISVEDDTIIIGINEDGLADLGDIDSIDLPKEKEEVTADTVCGMIVTDQGELEIYSPVDGVIVEVNSAVLENPNLLMEDTFGDGWLIRIEPDDMDDLDGVGADDDDEDDEDEDEDDEEIEEE